MCRMFGFRSVLQSQVHRSLVDADNALAVQSAAHPHGWGVAYFLDGTPHLLKGEGQADADSLFHRISGVVTSQTVVAHIRQATQGAINTLNCHPFQYGRWVFAHNGDVPCFDRVRDDLLELVAPVYRRFLLGTTDSEVLFHLFLTHLSRRTPFHRPGTSVEHVRAALEAVDADVRRLCAGEEKPPLLTFLVTDGQLMAARQGGKALYWSTHKTACPQSSTCPHFTDECIAPTRTGFVNHFLVSSEPLSGENVWTALEPGEFVAVDHAMRFYRNPPAM